MEIYYLDAFRVDSSFGCSTLVENFYDSITSALRAYYFNVGSYSSSLSNCVVCSFDEDENFIKKARISNRELTIYVYLQKFS